MLGLWVQVPLGLQNFLIMHIDNNIFCFNISFKFKRNCENPFWVKYKRCVKFFNKQINNCYNLYYKYQGKEIIDPLLRYKLQHLLDNADPENKVLGIAMLINYSAGNDLLKDCLFRMYSGDDLYEDKKYFKIGNIQLSEKTKIQELIDELRKVYLSIPEGTSSQEIIHKCNPYLVPIGYWMFYHPRIGSQCCNCLGEFEHCHNPHYRDRAKVSLIESNSFFNKIETWDWRLQRYDYGIPAEEYWKHHKKPDLSIL